MSAEENEQQADSSEPTRRRFLILEVLALCGTHLSTIIDPLFRVFSTTRFSILNPYAAAATIGELPRLGLYLFVMYSSGDPMSLFGLRRIRWRTDLIALAVAVAGSIVVHTSDFLLSHQPWSAPLPQSLAERVAPIWLIALLSVFIGAYEEVAYRGYLIPRLEELTGSTSIAVILQALFFGLVHSYQGFPNMVRAAAYGLVMGLVFIRCRSVWPLAVAHALTDFALFYRTVPSIS